MTKESMAVLLRKQGKTAACAEGECEVELARNIGADLVVTGQAILIERTYVVTLKLHEVRTAALLPTRNATGPRSGVAAGVAGGLACVAGAMALGVAGVGREGPVTTAILLGAFACPFAGWGIGAAVEVKPRLDLSLGRGRTANDPMPGVAARTPGETVAGSDCFRDPVELRWGPGQLAATGLPGGVSLVAAPGVIAGTF